MRRGLFNAPYRHRIYGETGAIAAARRAVATGRARTDLDPDTVANLVEGAALSVLDEATRSALSREAGRRLVILAGLGVLGLSWREAAAVVDAHAGALGLEDAR